MHIIPVIDLLEGKVVHAKQGKRSEYRPIQSSICPSTDPLDIVSAFLDIFPFDTVYIADLNRIQQNGNTNIHTINKIRNRYPELCIWLDAGPLKLIGHHDLESLPIYPVIGSESLDDWEQYLSIYTQKIPFILSLDFMLKGFQGPQACLNYPEYWPENIITMTLAQVGSNAGVNNEILDNIIIQNQHSRIYAAGGVRHIDDLTHLATKSVAGALIATALHHRQITSSDLLNLIKQ